MVAGKDDLQKNFYNLVNYDRLGDCSPEKDCFR